MPENKTAIIIGMVDKWNRMATFFKYIDLEDHLKLPEHVDTLHIKPYLNDGKKWMRDVYAHWVAEIWPIWKLLPTEIWMRYKTWGCFNDHRECRMLEEKLPAFKKLVKNDKRPILFRKGKINAIIEKRLGEKSGSVNHEASQSCESVPESGQESGADQ